MSKQTLEKTVNTLKNLENPLYWLSGMVARGNFTKAEAGLITIEMIKQGIIK